MAPRRMRSSRASWRVRSTGSGLVVILLISGIFQESFAHRLDGSLRSGIAFFDGGSRGKILDFPAAVGVFNRKKAGPAIFYGLFKDFADIFAGHMHCQ